jgi:ribose 5-phosphate isomerase A
VDGADELDGALNLTKGGGGALLREKIVATASDRMIVIADDSKLVESLGAFPLPVEVVPFGAGATINMMTAAAGACGCTGDIAVRKKAEGELFITDGGHYIYDCRFGIIADPVALARALNPIPGVVEHGLFIGIAGLALVGGKGGVREIEPR